MHAEVSPLRWACLGRLHEKPETGLLALSGLGRLSALFIPLAAPMQAVPDGVCGTRHPLIPCGR